MKKGILYGIGAYTLWGLLPVYWKWLHTVPALQLLCHRIFWSFIVLVITIYCLHQWQTLRDKALNRRVLRIYLVAALLIGFNWLVYVWSVNAGFILEASLGYFINPLISVLLGVLILHERLRPLQWASMALAAAGVLYLTLIYGSLPWIALSLATSFAIYGYVKKIAPLSSLYGLTLETGILLIPAILVLVFSEFSGQGAFMHSGAISNLLMAGAGIVTIIPLLMFSSAAQRIPLTMVGVLQYISPTLQFFIGFLLYKEPFTPARFVGYALVWVAVILFCTEQFITLRSRSAVAESD